MFILRWRWSDGKEGSCIGTHDSLATIKWSLNVTCNVKFLLYDDRGKQATTSWHKENNEEKFYK